MSEFPRVFATRGLPGTALERLRTRSSLDVWPDPGGPSPDELIARTRGAVGLLCLLTDRVDRRFLDACPELRVVSSVSVGVDHIDLAAADERGIAVGHTPGVLTEATADLTWALLLAAARRIPEAERWLRDGHWTPRMRWEPDLLLGRQLGGTTLGIVGLGAIGLAVARRAYGFGMRIVGCSRNPRPDSRSPRPEAAEFGVEPMGLERLLAEADFVSLHVPLTPETRGLIDASALARMKQDAVLINTARGGVVDQAALVRALETGQIGAAALDVFEEEPLPRSSRLLELPNVVMVPHLGSATFATRARMAELAVDNLLAGLDRRPMPHCANPQVETARARPTG